MTFFQGHRFVRNINYKLRILDSCPLWFKRCSVATYIQTGYAQYDVCDWCVFKGDSYHIFLSRLVRNFNFGIYSDTINETNVKLCMMALLIELYRFILLSVTLTIFEGHGSIRQFENVMFLSS